MFLPVELYGSATGDVWALSSWQGTEGVGFEAGTCQKLCPCPGHTREAVWSASLPDLSRVVCFVCLCGVDVVVVVVGVCIVGELCTLRGSQLRADL